LKLIIGIKQTHIELLLLTISNSLTLELQPETSNKMADMMTICYKPKTRRNVAPRVSFSLAPAKASGGGSYFDALADDSESDNEVVTVSKPLPSLGSRKSKRNDKGCWNSNLVSNASTKHGSFAAWSSQPQTDFKTAMENEMEKMKDEMNRLEKEKALVKQIAASRMASMSIAKRAEFDKQLQTIETMKSSDFLWGDLMMEEENLRNL